MKKKWYRSEIVKGMAILLSYILLIVAVFGGVIMMRMGRAGINLESAEKFSESYK
ncbi:membrane or secreted protein, partial [gut metagenome]